MSHNHILKRLLSDSDAYKHAWRARSSWNRWLLDKTFTDDLCETLLTETSPDLEFETYRPGDARSDLPKYFLEAIEKSGHPEYLTPYTLGQLSEFQLAKVRGYDAGFAIKPDGDIVIVHNNSELKGIADKLLAKAISMGGKHLDHFDGRLSHIYAKKFPTVYKTDPWDDNYAPDGWKYTPLSPDDTYYGGEHTHRTPPVTEDELTLVRKNYAAGKPHVIYRQIG